MEENVKKRSKNYMFGYRKEEFWLFWDSKNTYNVSIHVWTLQGKLLRS